MFIFLIMSKIMPLMWLVKTVVKISHFNVKSNDNKWKLKIVSDPRVDCDLQTSLAVIKDKLRNNHSCSLCNFAVKLPTLPIFKLQPVTELVLLAFTASTTLGTRSISYYLGVNHSSTDANRDSTSYSHSLGIKETTYQKERESKEVHWKGLQVDVPSQVFPSPEGKGKQKGTG